jgi:hypothetical protein
MNDEHEMDPVRMLCKWCRAPSRRQGFTLFCTACGWPAPAPLCGTSRTPYGWYCQRIAGHDGPCAGVPVPRELPQVFARCLRTRRATLWAWLRGRP